MCSTPTVRDARGPLVHMTTRGRALLLGKSLVDSSVFSGTLRAPTAWPAAYSAGSQTSISTPFSRLISRTASAVDTTPPRLPRTRVGHSSRPPETSAASSRYQLSRKNFKMGTDSESGGIIEVALARIRPSPALLHAPHHAQARPHPPRRIDLAPGKPLHWLDRRRAH